MGSKTELVGCAQRGAPSPSPARQMIIIKTLQPIIVPDKYRTSPLHISCCSLGTSMFLTAQRFRKQVRCVCSVASGSYSPDQCVSCHWSRPGAHRFGVSVLLDRQNRKVGPNSNHGGTITRSKWKTICVHLTTLHCNGTGYMSGGRSQATNAAIRN